MDTTLIKNILQSSSQEELDNIIAKRISEEKQNYRKNYYEKQHGKHDNISENSQDYSSQNFRGLSYISPPSNEMDIDIKSFDEFLDPKNVVISIANSWPVYSYCYDDEKDIYNLLAHELSKLKNPTSTQEVLQAVSESVFAYIGGVKVVGDDFSRLSLLKPSSELDDDEHNKISAFKGTQKAWCVERSCMAHQLFKFLGIDSKIIMATISNNGERQIHSFNLLKINNKTILFDCSVMNPPLNNEKYNAVALTLPSDVYDKDMMGTSPLPDRDIVGLSGKKYKIIYDIKNRKIFENANFNSMQ